jgi:transposase
MKEYILKPIMTRPTLTPARTLDKPVVLPPRQPLPRAVIDATRPRVKLGLDVHLELIMAVSQQDHASLKAPRQFTRAQLVAHVRQLVAAGQQVFCVQESCGFGFTLHRELVAAGAQSFLITPIALNGARKTDKLDARALCLRLARWLDGNRDELAPIRIPSAQEQQPREGTRRRKFLGRLIRMLGNRGHGQARLSLDPNALRAKRKRLQALPAGARATGRSLRRSIRGCASAWRNSGR